MQFLDEHNERVNLTLTELSELDEHASDAARDRSRQRDE